VYWGPTAVTVCGKIVTVWSSRPKMVAKTLVVTVVGSLKGLAVAVMRTGAVVISVAVTAIKDILLDRSKGWYYECLSSIK
jgi:hypothetical protein